LAAGALALTVGVRVARADDYQLHFVATGSAAATDNVFSAPDGGPGTTPRDADLNYTLSPGVVASYGTPRTTHELSLNTSLNGYADHTEAWGLQLFGDYRAAIAVSPLTDMALSAGVSRGTTNAISQNQPASGGTAAPSQSGQIDQTSVRADEVLIYSLSEDTRLSQTAGTSYSLVTDAANNDVGTLQATVGAGFGRGLQRSVVGVEASVNYLSFDRPATMTASAEPDRRADARVGVHWRRDLSQRWAVGADGGVVAVLPIDCKPAVSGSRKCYAVVPIVSVSASYIPQWGTATLTLGRAVTANPFIAQQTVAEAGALSLNLPLPWLNSDRPSDDPQWIASGALAVAHSSVVNADDNSLDGSVVNGLFDVGLSYVPRPETTYALRLQHTRQKTLQAATTMDGMMNLQDLSRSTLLFTFTYRYPGRIETRLPRRELLRADQAMMPLQERDGERRRR
jgi:hypothetical protein